jgi:hypothetical protein
MVPGQHHGYGPHDPEDDGVQLAPNVGRGQEAFARMKPDFRQWLEATEPGINPRTTMGTVSFVLSHCAARDVDWILTEPSVDAVREALGFVKDQFPDMLEGRDGSLHGVLGRIPAVLRQRRII